MGVALLVAAVAGGLGVLRLALLGLIAFSTPHAIYHAANPAPGLSDGSNALTVALLGAQVMLPLLLVLARNAEGTQREASPAAPAGVTG